MIKLRGIGKHFQPGGQRIDALHPLDLDIAAGEFVSITGPSGSGKTSLMNMLGLLDLPSEGEYWLDGVAVAPLDDVGISRLRSEKIGFVFQSFQLLNHLTALENVMLPQLFTAHAPAQTKARASQLLQRVGLGERLMHKPAELSGGQRQRVAIARALMNEPALLLADEPTGNLDSSTTADIMQLLAQLNAQGQTLVLVTHEPDIAQQAARCLLLKDGVLVADSSRP